MIRLGLQRACKSKLATVKAIAYPRLHATNANQKTKSSSVPQIVIVACAGSVATSILYYYNNFERLAQLKNVNLDISAPVNFEQAILKIRAEQDTVTYDRETGLHRRDKVQLGSNSIIEDSHAELATPGPGEGKSKWSFFGVYDGHIGPHTSRLLQRTLLGQVAKDLKEVYATNPAVSGASIDQTIQDSFLKVDKSICYDSLDKLLNDNLSKTEAAHLINTALTGACALVAFYDSKSQLLRVAVTGDCRAVLGQRSPTGDGWTATPLSVDQTGANEEEAERIRALHPGEVDVVKKGRVLGLEPSRSFGDSQIKWAQESIDIIKKKYFYYGYSQHDGRILTPPYVTAEPVVTTTKIEPLNGDFVVLACDGLWELLTNEEVIGLVGRWIDDKKGNTSTRWTATLQASDEKSKGQKVPDVIETPIPDAQRFLLGEENAATHLLRNALGGRDEDQLCAMLTLKSPVSRNYRDDLTIQVVFFGDKL